MKKEEQTIIWIVIALVVLLFFSGFGMMGFGYGGMMNMMYGNYGFGFGIFNFLINILITIGIVLLIVWLIKQIQKK